MIKKQLIRLSIGFGLILTALFVTETAFAENLTVVEVRRNIPLSDKETIYRDYYINGGAEAGLKANQVVGVLRRVPVKDNAGVQSFGEIEVPVGKVKVLFVQGRVAVARDYQLVSRKDYPVLEQSGIMSGDRIDVKPSFVDSKKDSDK